jgi:MFS family permease
MSALSNDRQLIAGRPAGVLLTLAICMPVMGTASVAPVLPQIQEAFRSMPNVEIMAPIALTIPALMIAVFGWLAGLVADRFGRRQILLAAMLMYSVFGMAPLILESLPAIVLSRALTGIAEAVIMTVATTLIGDYFSGAERKRYLSLSIGAPSIAAIIFIVLAGALGEFGWRTPFWLYIISALLFLPMSLILFEPKSEAKAATANSSANRGFPLVTLLGICALTLVCSIAFFIPVIQIGFLLNLIGVHSPQVIGLIAGAASIANVVGAISFTQSSRFGTRNLLGLSFAIAAIGLVIISQAHSIEILFVGAVFAGLSGGIFLPALLNTTMNLLHFEQRGRGMGIWQASFWLGQFLNPLIILGLAKVVGGLPSAVGVFGVIFCLMFLGCLFGPGRRAGIQPANDVQVV